LTQTPTVPGPYAWKSAFDPRRNLTWPKFAAERGLNPDELAQQVLSCYPEDDKRFIEAVNLGLASAERGDFVEHEEVGKSLDQILRS
jgi:predicted transcriptional regulator